jgi:hypothetical protein
VASQRCAGMAGLFGGRGFPKWSRGSLGEATASETRQGPSWRARRSLLIAIRGQSDALDRAARMLPRAAPLRRPAGRFSPEHDRAVVRRQQRSRYKLPPPPARALTVMEVPWRRPGSAHGGLVARHDCRWNAERAEVRGGPSDRVVLSKADARDVPQMTSPRLCRGLVLHQCTRRRQLGRVLINPFPVSAALSMSASVRKRPNFVLSANAALCQDRP